MTDPANSQISVYLEPTKRKLTLDLRTGATIGDVVQGMVTHLRTAEHFDVDHFLREKIGDGYSPEWQLFREGQNMQLLPPEARFSELQPPLELDEMFTLKVNARVAMEFKQVAVKPDNKTHLELHGTNTTLCLKPVQPGTIVLTSLDWTPPPIGPDPVPFCEDCLAALKDLQSRPRDFYRAAENAVVPKIQTGQLPSPDGHPLPEKPRICSFDWRPDGMGGEFLQLQNPRGGRLLHLVTVVVTAEQRVLITLPGVPLSGAGLNPDGTLTGGGGAPHPSREAAKKAAEAHVAADFPDWRVLASPGSPDAPGEPPPGSGDGEPETSELVWMDDGVGGERVYLRNPEPRGLPRAISLQVHDNEVTIGHAAPLAIMRLKPDGTVGPWLIGTPTSPFESRAAAKRGAEEYAARHCRGWAQPRGVPCEAAFVDFPLSSEDDATVLGSLLMGARIPFELLLTEHNGLLIRVRNRANAVDEARRLIARLDAEGWAMPAIPPRSQR